MYEWLIDSLNAVWRHGWSLTALGTAIFALLKQRKVKQQLRKVVPWLFGDDSEVKQYVQNQQRIEHKLDLLLQKEGIVWQTADLKASSKSVRNTARLLTSLTSYFALTVPKKQGYGRITVLRRSKRMPANKVWWAGAIVYVIGVAMEKLGLTPPDGWEAITYEFVKYGGVIIAMWLSRHKFDKPDIVKRTIQETPQTFDEMRPYLNDVHVTINNMFKEVQSGKMSDASKRAIEMYMKLYDVIKEYKPPEEKKGA